MNHIARERPAVWAPLLAVTLAAVFGFSTGIATAKDKIVVKKNGNSGFCTETSKEWARSCPGAVVDDYWIASAKCTNLKDNAARADCFQTAMDDRDEAANGCHEALDWRLSICAKTGEDRYDPVIDPADFETDYHNLMNPNPYFPLAPGNHAEFEGGGQVNTVDTLDATKVISGVTCIVSRDLVYDPVNLFESANDWYCQNKDTSVWYFGEETAEYAVNPADNPPAPEILNIDGSFQQGRDGAKGGIIFEANPQVGDTYVEESAIGEAEDVTDILSTTYSYGADSELDQYVPAALANLMCANHDCVVTLNYSPLEPGVYEHKYYARGAGVFLEVELDSGQINQLVDCNFDARCAQLPQPS